MVSERRIDVSDYIDELDHFFADCSDEASLTILKLDLEACLTEINALIARVGEETTLGQLEWRGVHQRKFHRPDAK